MLCYYKYLGPGNVLMDWYVSLKTNGEMKCDLDGKLGRQGTINDNLLKELLSHPYLYQKPPKSTGIKLNLNNSYFIIIININ